jgi:hypothetical protein
MSKADRIKANSSPELRVILDDVEKEERVAVRLINEIREHFPRGREEVSAGSRESQSEVFGALHPKTQSDERSKRSRGGPGRADGILGGSAGTGGACNMFLRKACQGAPLLGYQHSHFGYVFLGVDPPCDSPSTVLRCRRSMS